MPILSDRVDTLPANPIRALMPLADEARRKGKTVISFNIGEPDNITPKTMRQAGADFFLQHEKLGYGSSRGSDDIIRASLVFFSEKLGINGLTPEMLMVANGSSESIAFTGLACADSGDAIAVTNPCYSNYGPMLSLYGVNTVPIETPSEAGYHIILPGENEATAIKRISGYLPLTTKAILYSSPSNPTGAVYSEQELSVLLKVSQDRNIWLVADEAYNLLAFDGSVKPGSISRAPSIFDVAQPGNRENVIVFWSFSKMTGFCGGRIGLIAAPPTVTAKLVNVASLRGSVATPSEAAAAAINQVPIEYFSQYQEFFRERRDQMCEILGRLGILTGKPEGAFYAIAQLQAGIIAEDICSWLLTDYLFMHEHSQTVFLTPMSTKQGAGSYLTPESQAAGAGQVRIAYVANKSDIAASESIFTNSQTLYLGLK